MKRLMVLCLALGALGWAQSPFEGTWKVDASTVQFPQKPDVYLVQNGMFECKTCVPPIKIKADGQMQKVEGHSYMDMMMVKLVDDKHMEQATQKNGKPMERETDTLSADGKTITVDWVDTSSPVGKEVSGKTTLTRVAAGPAGASGFSGSWRAEKLGDMTAEGLMFTYKSAPDGLEFSNPTGQSYAAKFNGGDVAMQGDPGNTMVSLKKLGANSFEETDKRNGKVVSVAKITVEGKKMHFVVEDKEHGTTMKFVADKQ
jgi:hypothetical protein